MSTRRTFGEASVDAEESLLATFKELRHSPTAIAGLIIVSILIAMAIFSTVDKFFFEKALISGLYTDPHQMNPAALREPPSLEHPMGTDQFGRDVLARVIYGSRTALAIGVIAVGIGFTGGVIVGTTAAYFGGYIDDLLMRLMETLYAIPGLILAMAFMAIMGPSIYNLFIAYGIIGIPAYARVMRSEVLSIREEEYVEAAKAAGLPTRTVLFREIAPNGLAPVVVQATLSMGGVIIGAAALSFLGFGVQSPTIDWGRMLNDAQQALVTAPWVAVFPGLMIFITVMGFNMLGDGLRDVMDPRTTLRNWEKLMPDETGSDGESAAAGSPAAADGGESQ